jgi:hypothetical protein
MVMDPVQHNASSKQPRDVVAVLSAGSYAWQIIWRFRWPSQKKVREGDQEQLVQWLPARNTVGGCPLKAQLKFLLLIRENKGKALD